MLTLADFTPPQFQGIRKAPFSNFDTRLVERRLFRLLADFTFNDEVFGPVVAEKGFVTNYASLDPLRNILLFPIYALLADYGDRAATIHDWLYSGNPVGLGDNRRNISRREADQVFYRALRAEGISRWRASIFFVGVRLFGAPAYKK